MQTIFVLIVFIFIFSTVNASETNSKTLRVCVFWVYMYMCSKKDFASEVKALD